MLPDHFDDAHGWPAPDAGVVRLDSTVISPPLASLAQRERRSEQCRAAQRLHQKQTEASDKRREATRLWQVRNAEANRRHKRESARRCRRAAMLAGLHPYSALCVCSRCKGAR